MNKVIALLLLAILITLLEAWFVAAIIAGVVSIALVVLFLIGLVLHIFGSGIEAYNDLAFIKTIKTNRRISELRRKIKMKEALGYDVEDLKQELKQLLTK